MILTVKNTAGKGKKVKIFDARGTVIPGVVQYNTKTREVIMFLGGPTNSKGKSIILVSRKESKSRFYSSVAFKLLSVKVKIPGSYAIVNGKKI